MSSSTLQLLAIPGSLRAGSFNRALCRAAIELAPANCSFTTADIGTLPHYDADLDGDDAPEAVTRFKQAIAEADGLLIATPEYNYGIPGVLKNAIDWASRPAYRSVLAHKPVAIVGAAGSVVGTARAQGQLKQVMLGVLSLIFPYPEVLVARAFEKFEGGTLVDEDTRKVVRAMLGEYASWLEQHRVRS